MANKVIKIGNQSGAQQSSSQKRDAVYVDIDTLAVNAFHPVPKKTDEDEYIEMLITEKGSPEGAFDYIVSEESEFPDDSKEYIKVQYNSCRDYKTALQMWSSYGKLKVGTLADVNAVRNSLHQIFTWVPGERILLPECGSNLRLLLYEGITDYNVERIMAEIRHCVTQWEPRVVIQKVVNASTVDDTEDNVVHIEVLYTIPGLTDDQIYSEPLIYEKR